MKYWYGWLLLKSSFQMLSVITSSVNISCRKWVFGQPKAQEAYNITIFWFLMENSILKIFVSVPWLLFLMLFWFSLHICSINIMYRLQGPCITLILVTYGITSNANIRSNQTQKTYFHFEVFWFSQPTTLICQYDLAGFLPNFLTDPWYSMEWS